MSAATKTAALFIIGLIIGAAIGYGAATAIAPPRPAPVGLTGEVKIVALLPLTGVLSTYGENSRAAVELAASEVNDWLEARGAPWRLKLIVEDTATDPATCLSKVKSWHGQGVLFFVGPQSSSEVKEVKAYADANKLLVIAQSSTSPALSIPGDFIFRYLSLIHI